MEYRPDSLDTGVTMLKNALTVLFLSGFAGQFAWGSAVPSHSADAVEVRRVQAEDLKGEAKSLRQTATDRYTLESAECRKSLLVNNCLSEASERRIADIEKARTLETRSNALEREIRQYELQERRAERARKQTSNRPATVSVEGQVTTNVNSAAVVPSETGGGK